MFQLHPQLEKDTLPLGGFSLCRLLLMNDNNFPWFILVPERENVHEIHELNDTDRRQLWDESAQLARALAARIRPIVAGGLCRSARESRARSRAPAPE